MQKKPIFRFAYLGNEITNNSSFIGCKNDVLCERKIIEPEY